MNINDYIKTIRNSRATDWHNIPCWGSGSGPSYKDHFQFWDSYNGEANKILLQTHSNRATFKPDISISLAWGLDNNIEFGERERITEEWATKFPDKNGALSAWVDFFYNDSLVLRTLYAAVDGGRCKLPFPHLGDNGGYVVSREYSDIMKIINNIESTIDYDRYLNGSGITLIDESILNY